MPVDRASRNIFRHPGPSGGELLEQQGPPLGQRQVLSLPRGQLLGHPRGCGPRHGAVLRPGKIKPRIYKYWSRLESCRPFREGVIPSRPKIAYIRFWSFLRDFDSFDSSFNLEQQTLIFPF